MRIDAYTHFIPEKFFNKIVESGHADIGKRVREIPCIHDLDARKKVVDTFDDYAQILSYPMPPLELLAKGDADRTNTPSWSMTASSRSAPRTPTISPAGWRRRRSARPTPASREAERAIKNGALGVQIYTNIAGKPLDDPAFEPFFETMNKLDKPIWLHPARGANFPDYLTREEIEIRNLVDLRLVLRDRGGDGAAGVLQDHGQISEPEDHHPPFRRHRADAGRPHRPGLGPARRAHLGRGPARAARRS